MLHIMSKLHENHLNLFSKLRYQNIFIIGQSIYCLSHSVLLLSAGINVLTTLILIITSFRKLIAEAPILSLRISNWIDFCISKLAPVFGNRTKNTFLCENTAKCNSSCVSNSSNSLVSI